MVGFRFAGENKAIKVSEHHLARIAKIFQDSDDSGSDKEESDLEKPRKLLNKPDKFEDEAKLTVQPEFGLNFVNN